MFCHGFRQNFATCCHILPQDFAKIRSECRWTLSWSVMKHGGIGQLPINVEKNLWDALQRDWEIPYDPLSMKVYSGETPWWNFQTRLVTRFRGIFTRFMMVFLVIKCQQHSGGIRPWPSHPSNRIPRFPHLEQNWPGAPPKGSGLNKIPSVNANTLIVWSRKFSKSHTKPWLFGGVYWGKGIMSNMTKTY